MPVVQHGPRDRKKIALTFDADLTNAMRKRLTSGRVKSYYNAELIESLRRLRVPATLFLTGLWMEQYPDQTRDLAADPLFELATHSYDHKAFTAKCYTLASVAPADMLTDVRRAVTILDRLDPDATRWFRFPGGCYDGRALHELAPAGLTAVQLDVAGADGFARSPGAIVEQVVGNAQAGSIVVLHMHGGDNAPFTGKAIEPIVRKLRAQGYQLVTVTDLMRSDRPG
ncbi:polysaccharide deacetylase family protein [Kribbella deserti]|uniref:Polysaccharide deacetylase family protein n=1 Tax=Kribbella deserti TaxID=1926257 RepID=A0ABV6QQW5_9ACTN